jgi:hypothetical protein
VLEGAGNGAVPERAIRLLILAGVIALLSAGPSRSFFGRYPAAGGLALVAVVGLLFSLFPDALFLKNPSDEEEEEGSLYSRRRGARLLGIALLVATLLAFMYMTRMRWR